MGYSPKSAVERQISDGSKYDKYFPSAKNQMTLLKRNGSVEDTITYMKRIVKKYSYQTKDIAKVLSVRNSDGSLNIYDTVHAVYDFVCKYIKYNIEKGEQLRQPAYTWHVAQRMARKHPNNPEYSCDCDCMAIFCASIFRNLHIPNVYFKIASYTLMGNYQHVYVVVKTDKGDIICDPVYWKFDDEKAPIKQKEFDMDSLSGTDIYMLAGLGDNTPQYPVANVYVEQSDGSLGLLSGKAKRQAKKAKRKEKKQARKEARKEKKQAKKEIKAARKSGDKEALQKAKEKKRAAKEKINANRTGVGKAMKKVADLAKKAALAPARGPFLLLLRLNFRGLSSRIGNNPQALDKVKNIWKGLGGKTSKLEKAVNKGKGKKPLFGSKKKLGDLAGQIAEIGEVMYEYGMITPKGLEGLGIKGLGVEPVTMSVGAAITAATPIIAKVIGVLKDMGIGVPESGDELENEEYEEADDEMAVDTNEESDDYSDEYSDDEYGYDSEESFSDEYIDDGVDSLEDEYEEDGDFEGLGGYFEIGEIGSLGKGFLSRIFTKKGQKTKVKSKKDKASRKSEKSNKKALKKANKEQKKANREQKRADKKADKKKRKIQKGGSGNSESKERGSRIKNAINKVKNSKPVQTLKTAKEKNLKNINTKNMADTTTTKDIAKADDKDKESWLSKNKWFVIVGGLLLAGGITAIVVNNKNSNVSGLGYIDDMELS